MSELADAVLPLIRTRADLHRWSASNAHGSQMQEAVDLLEEAARTGDPVVVFSVTQRAIASALKVIMRADDSSGIIGDACQRLLDLHARTAAAAGPPAGKLVDWMIGFQFDNECDFFTLDPVAYAPALGERGMTAYRARLEDVAARLGPRPTDSQPWSASYAHEWFTLDHIAQRLAVLDRDVNAIIRTHARDRRVAARLQDTAEAFEEIGRIDLAIDWAKQAADFDRGHQSKKAAGYWCRLLAEHRPEHLLAARLETFRRWPTSDTATRLHEDAGDQWPDYRDEVLARLATSPRDAVLFAQLGLRDLHLAWSLAHSLDLTDHRTWSDLAKAYQKLDPLAVLPILTRLVEHELTEADARNYRFAARRLATMRKLAAGTDTAEAEVDRFVADLRQTHRRRPRLQQEFDRAGLP